jgi:hypothetical protein
LLGCLVVLACVTGCNGAASKPANPDSDLSTARSAVLTLDDLPQGFRVTSHAPVGAITDADKRAFAQCLNAPTTIFDAPRGSTKVSSQDFADHDDQIANDVVIAPKKGVFEPAFSQLTTKTALTCLEMVYAARLRGDGSGAQGIVAATRFPVNGVADRASGFELRVPAAGASSTDYIDLLVGLRKRAVVTVTADGTGRPFDRAKEIELLGDVFERLRSQVN